MLTDLPNVLTLCRIAAIPVIIALVAWRSPVGDALACIVFSAAAITDYFDGHFARTRSQSSEIGRMLDPIADKLLVGATLMLLAGQDRLSAWGLYPAIVILLREILVSGLREYLAALRVSVPVTKLAKWKTTIQLVAIGFLIAGEAGEQILPPTTMIGIFLLWMSAIFTIYTGWDYFRAGIHHLIEEEDA